MDTVGSEGSTLVVAETDPLVKKADDSPPDAGIPSTPDLETSHTEDEADQAQSLPSPKRDPYAIEVIPVQNYKHGYPQLTAFAGCDPNFAIYRPFKTVRHRCLLYMQDELRALEHALEKPPEQMGLGTPVKDDPLTRMQLIAQIKDKIYEYDKMLRSTKDLLHWPAPTERNRRSYVNYINNEQPVVEAESRFIKRGDDLVTLAGDLQDSWWTSKAEQLTSLLCPGLATAIFQTTVQAQLTGNNKQLRLVDKARFDTLVRVVMTCSTTALLIASSLALPWAQQADYESEAVLLLLTGVFAVLVAVFADATRGGLFAATVGYYAVLVLSLRRAVLCGA
ncbi:hypothetical protein MMC15_006287 [Xylographa vitiligo]|nr:hypothetical protein [Xylographa vitiligo]